MGGGVDVFVTKLSSSGGNLVYSTFIGGSSVDYGRGITVDSTGAVYVTGYTLSSDFPTKNAYDNSLGGAIDVFVTKLSSSGGNLVYSTFIGGYSGEEGNGITVDSTGAVYVTGRTPSGWNFPTKNAYDDSDNGGNDVFVTKLSSSGDIVYSTLIGGSDDDEGNGITVDSAGAVYVTGYTQSSDFPTKNAYDNSHNGKSDVFVTKLTSSGGNLVYSTFIGGSSEDEGRGITVDSAGAVYVTGYTLSSDFPTKNAYDNSYNGESDVFVTKLLSSGGNLVYSTFIGGSSYDYGRGITIDSAGAVYVTGGTSSSDFPTQNAYDNSHNENWDGFVTSLYPDGMMMPFKLTLDKTELDFGEVVVSRASSQAVKVTNIGYADLVITGVRASSEQFTVDVDTAQIVPGGSQQISITFAPKSEGQISGAITIESNAGNETIRVSGYGKPMIVLDKTEIDFGETWIGSPSSQAVKVTNIGNTDLVITALRASSNKFTVDVDTAQIVPGGSQQITITFAPKSEGQIITGVITIESNGGGDKTIRVSGSGKPMIVLDKTAIDFGEVVIGRWSKVVEITNIGSTDLVITGVSASSDQFTVDVDTAQIVPRGSQQITIIFSPKSEVQITGTITIESNGGNDKTIRVSGYGKPMIALNKTEIDFGEVVLGTRLSKVVEVTNIGNTALVITGVRASSDQFTVDVDTAQIVPGGSQQITITFAPKSEGQITGTITIESNGGDDKTINVTGNGVYVWSPTHPHESLWYQSANPAFTWTAVPEAVGYYALLDEHPNTVPTVDNGDFLFRTEIDYPNTPDGIWYFHVSPDEEKGNAPVYHRQIRIDTEPPVISSSTHPNQNLWSNKASAKLSWSVKHPESIEKYYYKLDKKPDTIPTDTEKSTTETSLTINNLPQGVNYFHIVAVDRAGYVGKKAAHYRILRGSMIASSPSHPDVVGGLDPPTTLWYQNANPVFTWATFPTAKGYYVILDHNSDTFPTAENAKLITDTTIEYPYTAAGHWFFHVRPKLDVGEPVVDHVQIRIETQSLPVIKSSTHPNQNLWSNQASATLSWQVEHPESVEKYYYKLDKNPDTIPTDADTATTKTTITFDNLPEGVNYFHIVWADKAGNVGQQVSHYRILRGGFSVSSSSHPDSGLWYQNSDAGFNWSKFPTASGYYTLLDGKPNTVPDETNASRTDETTIKYPDTDDGEWFFHVRSDLAVGEPVVEHLKIRIDTKPPAVTSSTHPDQELWSNQVSAKLSWTVDHPESVGKYYYKFDQKSVTFPTDGDKATTETALTVNELKEGVNYFHVVWEDKAGKVGKKAGHYRILRGGFSTESSSHPDASLWYQNQVPVFNWTAFPTATGYYVVLDGNPKTLPTAQNAQRVTDTTASFPNTVDGEWFFHVRPDLAVGEPVVAHEQIRIDSRFTPTVSSTTHQASWLALSNVELAWSVIHPESVEKFYYKVDQNPNLSVAEFAKIRDRSLATSATKTNLRLSNHPDGEYYLHVVAQDKAGDFGSTVGHYRFRIDTTPPLPVTVLESQSEGDNIILTWEAAGDAHSGVAKYEVFRSNRPDIVGRRIAEQIFPPFTDPGLANDGNEYFYTVNPVDGAGNVQRSGNIRISTRTGPIQPEISVDKPRVDFGGVELGTSKTEQIQINNDGNGILDIISIKCAHPDFEIRGTVSSIPPNRSDQIEVIFAPSSTDTVSATIVISVQNPNSPEQLIELRGFGTQAELNVSQDVIDFGVVEVYKSKTQTVELRSVGTAALVISSIQVEHPEVKIDAPFIGENIEIGENRGLTITFSPTSAAPISTTLTIISNAPNSPKVIPIRGTVARPIIAVPDTLNFGEVQIHTVGTETLTIRNDGDADLRISSVTVEGDAEFQLVNFADGDSLVVLSGSSRWLTIQLTPSAIAEFTGKLTISSNDPNAPEKVITLTGSGKLPPRVVHEVSVIADAKQVPANGVSFGTITITAKKSSGDPADEQPVQITVSGSENIVEPTETVTDANGVATVNIKSTKIESKTILAIVGEELITESGSTTLKFIEPVNALSISANPPRMRADGKSQSKISINVAYPEENSVREPKPTLSLSPNLGNFSAITDNGDGTYAATYTAPEELNQTTSVTLTARIGDKSEQVALEIIHAEVIIQKSSSEPTKVGEITTLNGAIFPTIETEIKLSFEHENQELNDPVKTNSQGQYQYKFPGNRAGTWSVTAKWSGDAQHQPAQSETLTFAVEKGETQITINAPDNLFSLTAGDVVTVSGKLTPSISQVDISVSLRNPDGEETTVPIQTDDSSKYQHQFKADFAGVWRVQVHFAGNDDYVESQTTPLDLPIGTELGRAIIVAGGPGREEDNPLWNTTRYLCNHIFLILRERGYSRDMIHYLSPAPFEDVDGDGQNDLNGKSTVDELRKAITELPLEFFKKNPSAQLVIYYTGHSGAEQLELENEKVIATAQQINQWLDLLQMQTKMRKIVVIIDGSQSGSFIDDLAGDGRVIITSTDSAKTVNFDPDGRMTFTEYFSQYIAQGHSITESFLLTEEGFIGLESTFGIQPKLESDGDGVPNQERDRQIAKQLFIGSDITPGTTVPVIDKVSTPQTIVDTNSAEFWVEVHTVQGINEVWVLVTPPDYKPPADGVSELPVLFLLPSTDGKRYEGSYDGFEKVGNYTITFFAEDLRDKVSAPKQTTVTVKQSQVVDPNGNLLTTLGNIKTALLPVYPNPSNPETWIPFDLAVSTDVDISIYDISGKLIRRLSLGHRKAGNYRTVNKSSYWDGLNEYGESVTSGIYFVQMRAGDFVQMRRLVILK